MTSSLTAYCQSLRGLIGARPRLLLVQVPQMVIGAFNREVALNRGYYAFPPTGLQCLVESIAHRDVNVQILDINFQLLKRIHTDPSFTPDRWPEILDACLESFHPHLVGISCMFDTAIGALLEALRRVRLRSSSVVIAGGVIATYEHRRLLAPDMAHFVICGEGENKLNLLLDGLLGTARGATELPGIHFQPPGEPPQESVGPPDKVDPAGTLIGSYDLVPIEEYHLYGSLNPYSRRRDFAGQPFAAIQLARGCRAECSFCAVRDFMGRGVRHRPVEDVLAEMDYLIHVRGVRHFEWLDDDLLFHRKAAQAIMKEIIARKWDIHWSANNGLIAASLDEETLALIQESGCSGFKIGIETGNPEMLKAVRKPGTHGKFLEFSRRLRAYPKPFVGGNFIIGLPGETFAQMVDSFCFALEMNLDWSAITVCQAIRGASAFANSAEYFEKQMRDEGATTQNFIPSRQNSGGVIITDSSIMHDYEIFNIQVQHLPSENQVKEIWFTFNIIINYFMNKNLTPEGRPEKFIAWVETAYQAYPTNPYMAFFLSLSCQLLNQSERAAAFWSQAQSNCTDGYWKKRFEAFHLSDVTFPATARESAQRLSLLREKTLSSLPAWVMRKRRAI